MMTASIRFSRKNEPRKIIIMQKVAGKIAFSNVSIKLYKMIDQESRVIIWNTANED